MRNVLIVSNNALSFSYNNGRTLNSIFSDFEEGSVSQVFFNDEAPESKVAKKFYKITGRQQFLSCFRKERYSAGEEVEGRTELKSAEKSDSITSKLTSYLNKNFESVKLIVRDLLYSPGLVENKKLLEWVKLQDPKFIFLVVGNSKFPIHFVINLSRSLGIPYFVYITDDYVIYNRPSSLLGRMHNNALRKSYKNILASANAVFTICPEMAREFKDFFGVDSECLINCNLVAPFYDGISSDKNKITVVYAGGLHLGRKHSLCEFAERMSNTCSAAGYKFSLDIYTNDPSCDLISSKFDSLGITYKGSLPWSKLQSKLRTADFLLHVESFEPRVISKTRLSLSTKIPEYLSSGTCVLAYGPEELASIKLFKNERVGISLSLRDPSSWANLERALIDRVYKDDISSRAHTYVKNHFSPLVVKSRLIKKILEI
jgi:hypothetical protein